MNGSENNHAGFNRREELERASWHYGVRHQPINLGCSDVNSNVAASWDPENGVQGIAARLAGIFRRLKPNVVITHDLGGECGHQAHALTAEAVKIAYDLAADARLNIEGLPAWQIPKLYLHLYLSPRGSGMPNPQVTSAGFMCHSWEDRYPELGNKSSREVVNEGLECHQDAVVAFGIVQAVSRAITGELFDGNASEDWGLHRTQVGPDAVPGDFFQNVAA